MDICFSTALDQPSYVTVSGDGKTVSRITNGAFRGTGAGIISNDRRSTWKIRVHPDPKLDDIPHVRARLQFFIGIGLSDASNELKAGKVGADVGAGPSQAGTPAADNSTLVQDGDEFEITADPLSRTLKITAHLVNGRTAVPGWNGQNEKVIDWPIRAGAEWKPYVLMNVQSSVEVVS